MCHGPWEGPAGDDPRLALGGRRGYQGKEMYRAEGARTRPCPVMQSQVAKEGGVMSHTAQSPACLGTD